MQVFGNALGGNGLGIVLGDVAHRLLREHRAPRLLFAIGLQESVSLADPRKNRKQLGHDAHKCGNVVLSLHVAAKDTADMLCQRPRNGIVAPKKRFHLHRALLKRIQKGLEQGARLASEHRRIEIDDRISHGTVDAKGVDRVDLKGIKDQNIARLGFDYVEKKIIG